MDHLDWIESIDGRCPGNQSLGTPMEKERGESNKMKLLITSPFSNFLLKCENGSLGVD